MLIALNRVGVLKVSIYEGDMQRIFRCVFLLCLVITMLTARKQRKPDCCSTSQNGSVSREIIGFLPTCFHGSVLKFDGDIREIPYMEGIYYCLTKQFSFEVRIVLQVSATVPLVSDMGICNFISFFAFQPSRPWMPNYLVNSLAPKKIFYLPWWPETESSQPLTSPGHHCWTRSPKRLLSETSVIPHLPSPTT